MEGVRAIPWCNGGTGLGSRCGLGLVDGGARQPHDAAHAAAGGGRRRHVGAGGPRADLAPRGGHRIAATELLQLSTGNVGLPNSWRWRTTTAGPPPQRPVLHAAQTDAGRPPAAKCVRPRSGARPQARLERHPLLDMRAADSHAFHIPACDKTTHARVTACDKNRVRGSLACTGSHGMHCSPRQVRRDMDHRCTGSLCIRLACKTA